jgi:hypothetical protein
VKRFLSGFALLLFGLWCLAPQGVGHVKAQFDQDCGGSGFCAQGVSHGAPPTVWNAATAVNGMVVSGGGLVANANGNSNATVYTNNSHSSGKFYFEVTLTTSNFKGSIGICSPTFPGGAQLGDDGFPSQSMGWIDANGKWEANSNSGTTFASVVSGGVVMGLAVDLTGKLAWGTINGSTWNAGIGGSQNPSTPVGGLDISNINGGGFMPGGPPYFAAVSSSLDVFTANFAGPFTYAMPTGGYSKW